MRHNAEAGGNLEPIAIVGIGCRFPGSGSGRESFWQLLCDGIDTVTDIPADRWDVAAYYDADPAAPGKMYVRKGAFLEGVDRFDAAFFGISPREALHMDPQQRLLLEVTWEALEDAGIPADYLRGSRTGVFVGISTKDYVAVQDVQQAPEEIDAYFATGHFFSMAAGRLSYVLDLHGPSMAVDTEGASSLVAVHLACQSLRVGECEMALAGGVNLLLRPEEFVASCKLRTLAADGRCKTFDAAADGYGRGEGCGVVVLKRLSMAVADRDPILAVIRGSAVTHNGAGSGLTVPNSHTWQTAIRQALYSARIDPSSINYVEAYGTGMPLGDSIEMQAISTVLTQQRPVDAPLFVGSVKTNIGHLESAAGIAGLIKTVLALHHREIPAHLHLLRVNPRIPIEHLKVRVPVERTPWPTGQEKRRAGINSAGLSGVEAHVVLEDAPAQPAATTSAAPRCYLFPISARSLESLRALAAAYQRQLADDTADLHLADRCYTASTRRMHHEYRLALVGETSVALSHQLAEFLGQQPTTGWLTGYVERGKPSNIVFVCPGQGAQWIGMARRLIEREPVFLKTLECCNQAFGAYIDWSLVEELRRPAEQSQLGQIDIVQPVLCAIQIALAALWRTWGVEPTAVVGHSIGEVAAAQIAGILSLADAGHIICVYSRLLRLISGQGAMASVALSLERTREVLAPYADRLAVAGSNSPSATVVSGERAALEEFQQQCQRRGISCTFIKIDVASHSPQVNGLCESLLHELQDLHPSIGNLPLYSTVNTRIITGPELGAEYWVRNLREPILFSPTVEQMVRDGYYTYIELSPHPLLTVPVAAHLKQQEAALILPSMRRERDDQRIILGSLGALYAQGYAVNWQQVNASGHCVPLPTYPWQRQRYWPAPRPRAAGTQTNSRHSLEGHAFHGVRLRSPLDQLQYEVSFSADSPFLVDHQFTDASLSAPVTVVPNSSYVALVLSVVRDALGVEPFTLEQIEFLETLVLAKHARRTVHVILTRQGEVRYHFEVFSLAQEQADDPCWTLRARGHLVAAQVAREDSAVLELSALQDRCRDVLLGTELYATLQRAGYHYGPHYQWQEKLWRGVDEALVRMRAARGADNPETYVCPPGLLDATIQVVCNCLLVEPTRTQPGTVEIYIPVGIERLRFVGYNATQLWAHGRLRAAGPAQDHDLIEGDVQLYDDSGRLVLDVCRVRLKRTSVGALLRGQVRADAPPTTPVVAVPVAVAGGQLRDLPPMERVGVTAGLVRSAIIQMLGLDSNVTIAQQRPLKELGFDSLMAIELCSKLQTATGLALPATLVYDYPTLDALTRFLVARLVAEKELAEPTTLTQASQERMDADEEAVREVSHDELERLLEAELNDLAGGLLSLDKKWM